MRSPRWRALSRCRGWSDAKIRQAVYTIRRWCDRRRDYQTGRDTARALREWEGL
jgi:hypothetical protein